MFGRGSERELSRCSCHSIRRKSGGKAGREEKIMCSVSACLAWDSPPGHTPVEIMTAVHVGLNLRREILVRAVTSGLFQVNAIKKPCKSKKTMCVSTKCRIRSVC